MSKRRFAQTLVLALVLLAMTVTPALAEKGAGFGMLFYEGDTVRTVVPPAEMTKPGIDNLYVVEKDGAEGQLAIAAVAPGDTGYHGGKWAFHSVKWNVAPYLLTSESAVWTAEGLGDVTVTRVEANDFKCPIQP